MVNVREHVRIWLKNTLATSSYLGDLFQMAVVNAVKSETVDSSMKFYIKQLPCWLFKTKTSLISVHIGGHIGFRCDVFVSQVNK